MATELFDGGCILFRVQKNIEHPAMTAIAAAINAADLANT
jgi:hypothetical protein